MHGNSNIKLPYDVLLFEIQTDATLTEFFKTCINQIITEWNEEEIKGNKTSRNKTLRNFCLRTIKLYWRLQKMH